MAALLGEPVGVVGPVWTSDQPGTKIGRFPLSVERHTMTAVDSLVPGVTTVTLNARYYAVHALAAARARTHRWTAAEAQMQVRRLEVAMGAVSAVHAMTKGSDHRSWLSVPHGYNVLAGHMGPTGPVDIAAMSAHGVYAQPRWGFLAAYRGSEMRLRILASNEANLAPGERLDEDAVAEGLDGLVDLARTDVLDRTTLVAHEHLCLCRMNTAIDGQWLARLFAAGEYDLRSDRTRRGTLQMMSRAVQVAEIETMTAGLTNFVCFDPRARDDEVIAGIEVVPLWRGLMLRNMSVSAWRELWAWLVGQIDGYMPRAALAEVFADGLPAQTLTAFRSSLPLTTNSDGSPRGAESDSELARAATAHRVLGVLLLGAVRALELEGKELYGFQGNRPEDVHEELAPTWLAARATEWADRPVRDFARWLTDIMLDRAQRIALKKAVPNSRSGRWQVPTRVHLRDDFVFKTSDEGGGPASLRLGQLAGIASGMGLLSADDSRWLPGERADLLDD